MKNNIKITICIVLILIILLAWSPWLTDNYVKNKIVKEYCTELYPSSTDKNEEVCKLNNKFQNGNFVGTGMLLKEMVIINWIPFGRVVSNFEGFDILTFYGDLL